MTLVAKEQDVLERRMNVVVRGESKEIDPKWKEEGYMKKAYDVEQVALIAHAKAPEHSYQAYKGAIQQCVMLGNSPTHSKMPIKVVCVILYIFPCNSATVQFFVWSVLRPG
jgi:hypothetical protein